MKHQNSIFDDIVWQVEEFKLLNKTERGSIYQKGALLRVHADKKGQPVGLQLLFADRKEFIDLPLFMNLGLSYLVHDDVHVVTAIVGRDPCELHRLLIRFGNDRRGKLWFKFEAIPLFDDCVCKDQEDECSDRVVPDEMYFKSGHGLGGGTGQGR